MSKKITTRTPLRLGLCGGGTDVSPYCDLYGGLILSSTISNYAYVILETREDKKVVFDSLDFQTRREFEVKDIIHISKLNNNLLLHFAVYKYIMEKYNDAKFIPITINTFCDVPKGSGLGSSSALVVSLVKSLVELLQVTLDDYEVANLSHFIERKICGLKGGRQDQYSATFGGFNFMEFPSEGNPIITPLRLKNWIKMELEASIILFYTGVTRESANIINDQEKLIKKDNKVAINSLHKIKNKVLEMKNQLLKGDIKGLCESLIYSWDEKKKLALTISNSYIDSIYETSLKNGAMAGKVSGAGGGGYMFFIVPPEKRLRLISSLSEFKGNITTCKFTETGSESWTHN